MLPPLRGTVTATRGGGWRPSGENICPQQQGLRAWAARSFETARGAARESSPAVVAPHIAGRDSVVVAPLHTVVVASLHLHSRRCRRSTRCTAATAPLTAPLPTGAYSTST